MPKRVLVRGDAAAEHVRVLAGLPAVDPKPVGSRDDAPQVEWGQIDGVENALEVIKLARADGFDVQPDHVLFAHSCDPCCGAPHPYLTFDALLADPLWGNPLRGNPLRGNPLRGNPLRGNPLWGNSEWGNPFVVDPLRGNEAQNSTARPAVDRILPERELAVVGRRPRIWVLDTGLAEKPLRPALVSANRFTGDEDDRPSKSLVDATGKPVQADPWLDPVAGHGTFIAGLIEQLAPGCKVDVKRVIGPLGDTPESKVIHFLQEAAKPENRPDIISLSFGGTVLDQAQALASAVAKAQLPLPKTSETRARPGIVIVASAGNDGSGEPHYPAAYDGVIAVGALGPFGPAPWTNFGSWVDACAPGIDLVSSFFTEFLGPSPQINTVDPDNFRNWARWSGTSFAAPVVVAAIAREMILRKGTTAPQAVDRVINAPYALRLRCLGTVVNV